MVDFKTILHDLCESSMPKDYEDYPIEAEYQGWSIFELKDKFWCYPSEGSGAGEGPFKTMKDCKDWIYKQ